MAISVSTLRNMLLGLLMFCGLFAGIPDTQAADGKIWVNTKSGVHHCPGNRYYGAKKPGRYMSETDAKNGGNRPAYGAKCD